MHVQGDQIVLLETNLDDTPGEAIGYCAEQLWQAGALDVSTTALQMTKGRPGTLLSVQCRPAESDRLAEIIFRETTTLGLRAFGRSSGQTLAASRGESLYRLGRGCTVLWPVCRTEASVFSPEFAACREIADNRRMPLEAVYAAVRRGF